MTLPPTVHIDIFVILTHYNCYFGTCHSSTLGAIKRPVVPRRRADAVGPARYGDLVVKCDCGSQGSRISSRRPPPDPIVFAIPYLLGQSFAFCLPEHTVLCNILRFVYKSPSRKNNIHALSLSRPHSVGRSFLRSDSGSRINALPHHAHAHKRKEGEGIRGGSTHMNHGIGFMIYRVA